jgi:hypothetical protein
MIHPQAIQIPNVSNGRNVNSNLSALSADRSPTVSSSGERTTIAGPEDGAVGSTSCASGAFENDHMSVYVTTSGGLMMPYQGQVRKRSC